MVSISYDPEVKALYIHLIENEKIVKTIPVGEGKYMDVSKSGKAVGLEIIFPVSTPTEVIDAIIGLKEEKIVKVIQ